MTLGSTQPVTEMSTRSISWGKSGRCVRLTTLSPSCAFVTKSGSLNFLEPSGPFQACNGTDLPLPFTECSVSWPEWAKVSWTPRTRWASVQYFFPYHYSDCAFSRTACYCRDAAINGPDWLTPLALCCCGTCSVAVPSLVNQALL